MIQWRVSSWPPKVIIKLYMNFKLDHDLTSSTRAMDLHSTVQGWIGYVKKLLVSQYFFNVLASKVKNPKWPEANHLNGYIYKQGHSLDFSKGTKLCTNYFPHPPPPTSKPQIISRYHTYDLRLFHQLMNLVTSLETDIRVWKKHSVKLFFFKSLSFMNFISYSLFYYQYIIWFFPLNFLRYKSAYHVYTQVAMPLTSVTEDQSWT